MKKFYFFAALAATALVSCTSDDFVGDVGNDPTQPQEAPIVFNSLKGTYTRADIYGDAAANLLGGNFYVTGTKGAEADDSPTPTLVFDNYLVSYTANTAGTSESNTANWEYVGVTPGTDPYADYAKLSALNVQTIKYWDYSVDQYDFLAFSTGTFKAVAGASGADNEIGVTAMKYGEDLANSAVAYSFDIPSVDAIKSIYISDITEVEKANYGKEVTLKFKNLGSKIRIALYETVRGYSVKDVVFYTVDGTTDFEGDAKDTPAALISADTYGLPTKGKINVYFPHVGNDNATEEDYNIAAATVLPTTASSAKNLTFGELDNFVGKEVDEGVADEIYIGRSLPQATFAGSEDADYYQTVFPVSESAPLTLRVDYTLVSIDGSNEEIKVLGAKAVVPSTYTKWLPNYAYTYIFKISDNTNGWTDPAGVVDGLFPITFDAVVAEATDANGEQTTITTVATPTITTYQQGHVYTTDEYSISGEKLYVQVMDNSAVPATLVNSLSATNSLLYAVDNVDATEAMVMDALQKRTTAIGADNVTGRNGITLAKNANINNTVTQIVNGVDDNPIEVNAGEAAEIDITQLSAGTYAYVYDYSTNDPKNTVTEYQPIDVSSGTVGESGKSYYTLTTAYLATLAGTATNFTGAEDVDNDYIYFSVTTNGTGTTTYSYVSVAGKTTVPAGLLKVAKSSITTTQNGGTSKVDGTIYFDKYITNDGKYAVKVIKVVA